MPGRALLRGMIVAATVACVLPAWAAPNDIASAESLAVATVPSGPGSFAVVPASWPITAATPEPGASVWGGAEPFWRKRWQEDTAAMARLGIDGERQGPVLSLPIEGDRAIRFTDEIGSCAGYLTCVTHHLEDYIADAGYYVVSVEQGEGGWTYMVDRRSGAVSPIAAPPVFSRDRKVALAWYPSMMEGPQLDVLHFERDGLHVEQAVVEGPCWPRVGETEGRLVPFVIDHDTIAWMRSNGNVDEMLSWVTLKRIDATWQMVCE